MSTPAGWYPQEDGRQRYWDGAQWTEHFAPGDAASDAARAAGATSPQMGTVAGSTSAERPWFKKKRVIIPGALVGLVIIGSALGGAGDAKTPTATEAGGATTSAQASQSPAAAPTTSAVAPAPAPTKAVATKAPVVVDKTPKIGTKVRDGKFEFVVTGVKCGMDKFGSGGFDTEAQGEFCRVSMTIANIGDEAQSMFGDNQQAFDAKNRKFSASTEAAIYDPKSQAIFEEINPGNTVQGRVYFDVPKKTKIELHDSMFSGGVEVALKK